MSPLSFSIEQGKGNSASTGSRLEAILIEIEANRANVSIDLISAVQREVTMRLPIPEYYHLMWLLQFSGFSNN
tara:strand:+ start:498 stop:716 length:219 start_codon:yes stop_codon:yes gene_type:complete